MSVILTSVVIVVFEILSDGFCLFIITTFALALSFSKSFPFSSFPLITTLFTYCPSFTFSGTMTLYAMSQVSPGCSRVILTYTFTTGLPKNILVLLVTFKFPPPLQFTDITPPNFHLVGRLSIADILYILSLPVFEIIKV